MARSNTSRKGTGVRVVVAEAARSGKGKGTLRRVLAAGKPLTLPVSECMTPRPVFVRPKDPVGAAVRQMEEGGYRHLPVVDEAGKPVGVLSVKRIVHYLVEHFPATVYNLPPNPRAVPHEAEGA